MPWRRSIAETEPDPRRAISIQFKPSFLHTFFCLHKISTGKLALKGSGAPSPFYDPISLHKSKCNWVFAFFKVQTAILPLSPQLDRQSTIPPPQFINNIDVIKKISRPRITRNTIQRNVKIQNSATTLHTCNLQRKTWHLLMCNDIGWNHSVGQKLS